MNGEVVVTKPIAITQLSRSGMQMESTFPLPLNTLHSFRLKVGRDTLIVRGRIVHARLDDVTQDVVTYISGVEFVELSDQVVAAIGEYLETVANNRGNLRG